MERLINFVLNNNILSFAILIENNTNQAYSVSVDMNTEMLSVVHSDVPEDYKIYERQARMALREYKGKNLPDSITTAWY